MQLTTRFWALLSLLLIFAGSSYGQDELVLTLEKSLNIAFDRNPQLKMAEKEVKKAKTGVWEAYSNILPQLSASVNFEHNWEIQQTTIPNFLKPMMGPLAGMIPELSQMPDFVQLSFGLENTFVYGASVTQPLFLGGAGIAGIQIANAAKRASERNLELQRQNLIYQTANAFYACLVTREIVEVQEEALNQANANFEIVKKRYEAGSASGFDKMRAEVEVANLKPVFISANNHYQATLTQLKAILGLEKETKIAVEGQFEYFEDEFGDKSLEEIQTMALEKRAEMKALSEQKYIARKGITLARSSFMPKLFFQTDYSYLAMRNDYKFTQDDFSKGFKSAVSLQIPLFTGFRNCKQYQKAKLEYRIMEDTEKQVQDGLLAESELAYNNYREANAKYLSASQSVDLATEALRLANMMYEEGANTQLDVLNSQLALTQAKLNYVSSLYEYQMARYNLRKVTGTLTNLL